MLVNMNDLFLWKDKQVEKEMNLSLLRLSKNFYKIYTETTPFP